MAWIKKKSRIKNSIEYDTELPFDTLAITYAVSPRKKNDDTTFYVHGTIDGEGKMISSVLVFGEL